ncbi:MAG: hypothetical protein K0Q60_4921 [Microvirga sp.]|jgi:hypothetical protein|nr:hypothetical protein [Microvirga sp.]
MYGLIFKARDFEFMRTDSWALFGAVSRLR